MSKSISITDLYEMLSVKIGKAEASTLVNFIDEVGSNMQNHATKTDIKELELKIEQTKSELLKWFIGSFITLVIMIIGLFATILFKK